MDLSTTTLAALAIGAAVVAVAAVVVAVLALLGQRDVRHAYRIFAGGSREDVLSLLQRHLDEVAGLRRDVSALRARSDQLRGLMAGCVSRVATLRYDAFDDMGGRLSYSTALLDEHGDGVVLTSIHGRADTRTYAKPIQAGQSAHTLSTEETEAIERALDGAEPPAPKAGTAGSSRKARTATPSRGRAVS